MTSSTTTDPRTRAVPESSGTTLALAARASLRAVVAIAVVFALVHLSGLTEGADIGDVWLGLGLVLIGGVVGSVVKARAVRAPEPVDATGAAQASSRLLLAMAGDFVLLLALFAVGVAIVIGGRGSAADAWKFTGLEGFGLSFAGAGMIFLLASSATIAQDSARRAAHRGQDHPATPSRSAASETSANDRDDDPER